jgi:hypothetical protein
MRHTYEDHDRSDGRNRISGFMTRMHQADSDHHDDGPDAPDSDLDDCCPAGV